MKNVILKKINIIKPLLVQKDKESFELYSILFKDELLSKVKVIIDIKNEIKDLSFTKALNLINQLKQSISNELYKKPCHKDWFSLIEVNENVRFCDNCKMNVYLINDYNEFCLRKNQEQSIAIGISKIAYIEESEKQSRFLEKEVSKKKIIVDVFSNFRSCYIILSKNDEELIKKEEYEKESGKVLDEDTFFNLK